MSGRAVFNFNIMCENCRYSAGAEACEVLEAHEGTDSNTQSITEVLLMCVSMPCHAMPCHAMPFSCTFFSSPAKLAAQA